MDILANGSIGKEHTGVPGSFQIAFRDMIKQIKDNNWTRAFGEVILDEFTNLVLARNVEQIRLRSEVTHALTLLMTAILNVCEMSMEES